MKIPLFQCPLLEICEFGSVSVRFGVLGGVGERGFCKGKDPKGPNLEKIQDLEIFKRA